MHAHNRTLISKLGFADNDKKLPRHDLACQYLGEPEQTGKLLRLLRPELLAVPTRPVDPWENFLTESAKAGRTVRLNGCMDLEEPAEDLQPFLERFRAIANGSAVSVRHESHVAQIGPSGFEAAVQKGDGKYATTIGFLDLTFDYVWSKALTVSAYECARMGRAQGVAIMRALKPDADMPEEFTGPSPNPRIEFSADGGETCGATVVVEVKIQPVPVGDLLRQMNFYRQHVRAEHWVVATDYDVSRDDVVALKSSGLVHVRFGARFDEYVGRRQCDAAIPANSPEL